MGLRVIVHCARVNRKTNNERRIPEVHVDEKQIKEKNSLDIFNFSMDFSTVQLLTVEQLTRVPFPPPTSMPFPTFPP